MTDTYTLNYDVNSNGEIVFNNLPEGTNLDTTISGIIILKPGAIAATKPLNDNFTYINARVDTLQTDVTSFQAATISNVRNELSRTLSIYQTVNVINDATGDIQLTNNSIYRITPSAAINLKLPTIEDNTMFYQIYVQLNLDTYYATTLDTTWGFNDVEPAIGQAGRYNILYEHDGSHWVCGVMKRSEVV